MVSLQRRSLKVVQVRLQPLDKPLKGEGVRPSALFTAIATAGERQQQHHFSAMPVIQNVKMHMTHSTLTPQKIQCSQVLVVLSLEINSASGWSQGQEMLRKEMQQQNELHQQARRAVCCVGSNAATIS